MPIEKPKPGPLFTIISPFGVFVQICPKCGNEDEESQFELIEDYQWLACAKCGQKISKFSQKYTEELYNSPVPRLTNKQ